MKLKEFLGDTMSLGKGSVKYPIGMQVMQHRDAYNKLKGKESIQFKHQIYLTSPGNRRMIHVKVPSETVRDFYYDVIFEYSPDENTKSFVDCDIKVFSNSPSFVYTSAYVFAHWDPDSGKTSSNSKGMMIDAFKKKLPRNSMMVPGLSSKLGDEPIHDKPETRNPLGAPLFDKSLYYAAFYIMENVNYDELVANIRPTASITVYNNVVDFDQLMTARSLAAAKQKEDHKAAQKRLADAITGKEKKVSAASQQHGVRKPLKPKSTSSAISTSKTSGLKSPKRIG